VQIAFSVPQMQLARLDDFLALLPASPEPRLDALAAHCVKHFDRWRAPLSAAELDRRRREPLTQRQEALLARWGYPHVLDEYRFHMSLTGLLLDAQPPEVPPLPAEPLRIDAVTVFEEQAPQCLRAILRGLARSPAAQDSGRWARPAADVRCAAHHHAPEGIWRAALADVRCSIRS
jgi:hypothetical protein